MLLFTPCKKMEQTITTEEQCLQAQLSSRRMAGGNGEERGQNQKNVMYLTWNTECFYENAGETRSSLTRYWNSTCLPGISISVVGWSGKWDFPLTAQARGHRVPWVTLDVSITLLKEFHDVKKQRGQQSPHSLDLFMSRHLCVVYSKQVKTM